MEDCSAELVGAEDEDGVFRHGAFVTDVDRGTDGLKDCEIMCCYFALNETVMEVFAFCLGLQRSLEDIFGTNGIE